MRTTLRLATGLGLALALTACAGRTPIAWPSSPAAAPASIHAPSTAGTTATSTPGPTPTPATFHFDPSAVGGALAGVDRQLIDIDSSITATDSASGGEGQQP